MQRSLAAAIGVAGALAIGGAALAASTHYRAEPAGAFEIPATNSTAEGTFKLKLTHDGDAARFHLNITEPIQNVTMAHLHLGPPTATGGVVVWLYPAGPPPTLIPGTTEGHLASGTITEDSLIGELDNDWEGFVAALEAGNIYVNVHTTAFPDGEIRDQLHTHPDE
jgi:hypothetical protein